MKMVHYNTTHFPMRNFVRDKILPMTNYDLNVVGSGRAAVIFWCDFVSVVKTFFNILVCKSVDLLVTFFSQCCAPFRLLNKQSHTFIFWSTVKKRKWYKMVMVVLLLEISSAIRTSDCHTNAALSFIKGRLHDWTNWPGLSLAKQVNVSGPLIEHLADTGRARSTVIVYSHLLLSLYFTFPSPPVCIQLSLIFNKCKSFAIAQWIKWKSKAVVHTDWLRWQV